MIPYLPFLQAGPDTMGAVELLAIAIGLAGLAIIILFWKKKI